MKSLLAPRGSRGLTWRARARAGNCTPQSPRMHFAASARSSSQLRTKQRQMADWQLTLRNYAIRAEPQKIPPTIRLEHTDTSITVYDAFPKSIFHFLILPRPIPGFLDVDELDDLKTLLKAGKEKAQKVLESLAEDAKKLKADMEQEMIHHHGFKWDVWIGFHPVPSMKYVEH